MTDAIWQLLYPKSGGEYGVIDLSSMLVVEQGRGMPPLHYNTQRGTYQHGETPINMRLDVRVVQLALTDDNDNRPQMYADLARLLHRLNPNRNWAVDGTLTKCIYRKIMPGGTRQWRSDLVTVAGSRYVTSLTGRFAEWGLGAGDPFTISSGSDAGDYVVSVVVNENTLGLTQAMTASAAGVQYRVHTGRIMRDLSVLLESGPMLEDDRQMDSLALGDSIKLIAHDPLWKNPMRQSSTWAVQDMSNLIFYDPVNWPNRAVFPIWFGTDMIHSDTSLVYLGTWPSRPMIILTGPFTRVVVENASTGHRLNMVYTAVDYEQVVIDLDALTVTNNFGQNLMRYMSTPYAAADSDLITFGMYPDPQVSGGVNVINVDVSQAVQGKTTVDMYWYARYIGA